MIRIGEILPDWDGNAKKPIVTVGHQRSHREQNSETIKRRAKLMILGKGINYYAYLRELSKRN